jgi:hypothetical protein
MTTTNIDRAREWLTATSEYTSPCNTTSLAALLDAAEARGRALRNEPADADPRAHPVVWVDDASPFDGPQVKALLDENEKLRAQVARLRDGLRMCAVRIWGRRYECLACGAEWRAIDPEHHAPGCLAASEVPT